MPSTVFQERTIIVEEIFNGVGWGVMFVLYWQSMMLLIPRRRDWFIITFSTALFIIGTLYLIGCTILTNKIFVDQRNVPGGPTAALLDVYSQPIIMMSNAAFPLQSWLTDALVIYRCFIVYAGNYWVILFPSILLIGSLAVGSTLLGFESHPDVGFWSPISMKLAIPYFSLSISLNIIVTFLIVSRLFWFRSTIISALGSGHSKRYVSISSMLVESAALNTGCSLIFLVFYARGSPVSNIFQGLVCYCQITASLLIVLRVAQGSAVTKETIQSIRTPSNMSTLRFSNSNSKASTAKTFGTATTDQTRFNRDVIVPKEICEIDLEQGAQTDTMELKTWNRDDSVQSLRG